MITVDGASSSPFCTTMPTCRPRNSPLTAERPPIPSPKPSTERGDSSSLAKSATKRVVRRLYVSHATMAESRKKRTSERDGSIERSPRGEETIVRNTRFRVKSQNCLASVCVANDLLCRLNRCTGRERNGRGVRDLYPHDPSLRRSGNPG